jgi:hypothetical protein
MHVFLCINIGAGILSRRRGDTHVKVLGFDEPSCAGLRYAESRVDWMWMQRSGLRGGAREARHTTLAFHLRMQSRGQVCRAG